MTEIDITTPEGRAELRRLLARYRSATGLDRIAIAGALSTAVPALLDEIKRLEAMAADADRDATDMRYQRDAADARTAAAAAREDRLREALKPFADYAERIARDHPGWDHDGFSFSLPDEGAPTMREFRAARAALAPEESNDAG